MPISRPNIEQDDDPSRLSKLPWSKQEKLDELILNNITPMLLNLNSSIVFLDHQRNPSDPHSKQLDLRPSFNLRVPTTSTFILILIISSIITNQRGKKLSIGTGTGKRTTIEGKQNEEQRQNTKKSSETKFSKWNTSVQTEVDSLFSIFSSPFISTYSLTISIVSSSSSHHFIVLCFSFLPRSLPSFLFLLPCLLSTSRLASESTPLLLVASHHQRNWTAKQKWRREEKRGEKNHWTEVGEKRAKEKRDSIGLTRLGRDRMGWDGMDG